MTAQERLNATLKQINDEAIITIAKRLKTIGELNSEDLSIVGNLLRFYNEDMKKIEKKLSKLTGIAIDEVIDLIQESAIKEGMSEDVKEYYKVAGIEPIPIAENIAMQNIIASAIKRAEKDILKISRTTVLGIVVNGVTMPFKKAYNTIVDKAILAVKTGTTDYQTAIHNILKDLAKGTRVRYESGYTRRIDSAIRMNVLDGVRTMNRDIREQQGKEFGADGVYIMPHGLCAPDHMPYQGLEFTYEEFDKLNDKLEATGQRPIATGQMNCHHIAYDVIIGTVTPPYNAKELEEINKYSTEKVKWNGKEMARYEASQEMRKMETKIRYLKDNQAVSSVAGDKIGEKRYARAIKEQTALYKKRCEECGLRPKLDRLEF